MTTEDRQRKALRLRLKGLTYREIGAAMGVSGMRAWQLVNPLPAATSTLARLREAAKGRCQGCRQEVKNGIVVGERYLCRECAAEAVAGGGTEEDAVTTKEAGQ